MAPVSFVTETEPQISGTNFHVNVLGLLQFGLMPRIEAGGTVTALVGLHIFNTGAASYLVIPDLDDDEVFKWGFGANLGLRAYAGPRGQQGFYLGGFAEAARIVVEDDSSDLARYTRDVAVFAGENGTRWVWGSTLLDFGLQLGAAVPVRVIDEPIGPDGCSYEWSCAEEASVFPFGMFVLALGFFFTKPQ